MIGVQSPGAFTTVQDLGRPGHGLVGLSRAGAADPVALRLGNRLLGNPENAGGLEMTLLGGTFQFPQGADVAVTGAPCVPTMWKPFRIASGGILKLGPITGGVRSYLCVRGGIRVPLVGGSASTHVHGALGGLEGRALRRGDELEVGSCGPSGEIRGGLRPEVLTALAYRSTLRVTPGPQTDRFDAGNLAAFHSAAYKVSNNSNRLGIRLEGPALSLSDGAEMTTEGVPLGAVQVTSGGQPIILFVDQQTTGGYPKIANVITVDLPSVGQLRPGDAVRFQQVAPSEAQRLILNQEALLRSENIFL